MKDKHPTKGATDTQKSPADPTTELYKRAVEQADDKRKPGAGKKQPLPEGEAIGELGDELGGPA